MRDPFSITHIALVLCGHERMLFLRTTPVPIEQPHCQMSPNDLVGAAQIKGAVASPGPLQTGNARVGGLGSIGAKLCISTQPDEGTVVCK